jgi:gas vesicle protein
MSKRFGFGGLLLGSAIGAGIALLFTTKKGEELRNDLLNKISELCDKLKDIDSDEVKANIEKKVAEIEEGLKDLDSEKVKKIAKEKGEALNVKATELVEYAKEKGTPALEKTAKTVKLETTKVVREILKKLEEE